MEEVHFDRTQNTNANDDNLALKITDAYKAYSSDAVILNGFNMNVNKGTIYGLLGPSGCGKTTLLSCIIGRSRLNSGHIQLSMKKKKDIGYMPQELALYDEFNILETFHYFGSLYEMSYEDIKDKGEKLLSLMEMPPAETQFGSMSGGQQRRFSLCTALLHDPSLLILDEPTVGLDPIISASIWVYLKELTNRGKTIIITTHYIEEARLANRIGLMRKGILLSESTPQEIMNSCNADTLESAFLTLSQKQSSNHAIMERPVPKFTKAATTSLKKSSLFSMKRFKAQMLKHWYWSKRNWTIIMFVYLLPLFTMLIFNFTIGQPPEPLNVGVINNEISSPCRPYQSSDLCNPDIPISCKYAYEMEKHQLTLKPYEDVESAKKDVHHNTIWGYVEFGKNFTDMIKVKFESPNTMSTDEINESLVSSSLDMSNFIVSKLIQGKLYNSYTDLSKSFKRCNNSAITTVNTVPITNEAPVYGLEEANMSHYGSAAIISILELYLTFLFTALSINMEKNSGLIERSLASGLTACEIIVSQMLVQVIILSVQTCTVFILQFGIFKHPFLCGWTLPALLVFLQGLCGTFLGFAACILFDDRITTFLGVFLVMTQVFLSGIMWPIQGMHPLMKKVTVFMPLTLSVDAFRSMSVRNWNLSYPVVYQGFISILLWIFAAVLITILSLKFKQGIKPKK